MMKGLDKLITDFPEESSKETPLAKNIWQEFIWHNNAVVNMYFLRKDVNNGMRIKQH